MKLDFLLPAVLLLLPLAALPLFNRRGDALAFAYLPWLPADRIGPIFAKVWRSVAMIAMASIIVALSGPGQTGTQIQRTGRGAEILILLDRSSSMDAIVIPAGMAAGSLSEGDSKNTIVRRILSQFVANRRDDRFALTTFSVRPMPIVPFTERKEAILAGIAATGIGRGLPNTEMGSALLESINQFEGRSYSGSRIVLIVSDGGAKLDAQTQQQIAAGLTRNRIGLYWIYIRSTPNSPNLNSDATHSDLDIEEIALHRFFTGLPVPYHLYQADDATAFAAAMAEIDRQQNKSLTFNERMPRQDYSGFFYVVALICSAALVTWRAIEVREWA